MSRAVNTVEMWRVYASIAQVSHDESRASEVNHRRLGSQQHERRTARLRSAGASRLMRAASARASSPRHAPARSSSPKGGGGSGAVAASVALTVASVRKPQRCVVVRGDEDAPHEHRVTPNGAPPRAARQVAANEASVGASKPTSSPARSACRRQNCPFVSARRGTPLGLPSRYHESHTHCRLTLTQGETRRKGVGTACWLLERPQHPCGSWPF